MKLFMKDFEVSLVNDNMQEFFVNFAGPKDSLYEGGLWKIHVQLPDEYPYRSPSIGFENTIFHPNIDERSGSVCLDVINQTWSPMFDMVNIFEQFLPQLLRYPNAADPLNPDASNLYDRNKGQYEQTVKEYVRLYADPRKVKNMTTFRKDRNSNISKPGVPSDTQNVSDGKDNNDGITTETDESLDDEELSADEDTDDELCDTDNVRNINYEVQDDEDDILKGSVDEEIGGTMDL